MTDDNQQEEQEIEVEKEDDLFRFVITEKKEATNLKGEKVELEEKKEIEIPKDEDVISEMTKVLGEYQLSQNPPPGSKPISQQIDEAWDAKLPDGVSR